MEPDPAVQRSLGHIISETWRLFEPKTRRKIVISAILSAILAAMDAIGVGLVPRLIRQFVSPSNHGGLLGNASTTAVALVIVAFLIGKSVGSGLVMVWQSSFLANDEGDRSVKMFRRILAMPYLETSERGTAGLIRDLHVAMPQLYRASGGGLGVLIADGLGLLGLIVVIFVSSPIMGLVLAVVLVVAAQLYSRLIRSPTGRLADRLQVDNRDFLNAIGESFGGLKTLKAFGVEDEVTGRFASVRKRYSATARDVLVYSQVARYYLEIVLVVGLGLCLGVEALVSGEGAILASFGLLSGVAARAMPALARALTSVTLIKVAGTAVDDLAPDLAAVDELSDESAGPTVPAPAAAAPGANDGEPGRRAGRLLSVAGVRFRYPTREADALRGISLDLRPGELVAIQGESGAGKTTLVDVLIGLITPQEGAVNRPGGTVGYVAQETFVWNDTVTFNVALGRPAASDDSASEIWAALEAARLGDWARRLPDHLDTLLGERGSHMSGGERQRLGVARALFGHPGVLLLDEPTSALDTATSRSLMATLVAIKEQVGVMVVTHDPIVVEYADRTIHLPAAGAVPAPG
ncbi:MAG: ABC transporter ATP-binding protein [Acidimicrobiia bacterium]|nr:ABC transporter ATP-binding protein [Acidimicrobiia bacterium]